MIYKRELGPCEVCPDCQGNNRVICACVPTDPCTPVEEMVGEVGCPTCDGDGDHWCPRCSGSGAILRKPKCTCDENCDDPCPYCNRPTVTATRTAYRLGRKDAHRYASQAVKKAHTNPETIERFAKMIWKLHGRESLTFEDLSATSRTKMGMIAQEMLAAVGATVMKGLEDAPDEPVCFEAIAAAAEAHNDG